MDANHLFAITAFGTGILLLLGWAYLTTDNPRSNPILVKSLWLFVLPGAAIIALPNSLFLFPLSMWVLVLVEEGLKTLAARTEGAPLDRFWLVSLFGIWELMLAKPIRALTEGILFGDWSRVELLGLIAAACVAILMHMVTAAIYAFHFHGKLWAALITSWVVHTTFNESVYLFGPSLLASGTQALILAIILFVLWPQPGYQRSNDTCP